MGSTLTGFFHLCSWMRHYVVWKDFSVTSEEPVVSIIRVEDRLAPSQSVASLYQAALRHIQ